MDKLNAFFPAEPFATITLEDYVTEISTTDEREIEAFAMISLEDYVAEITSIEV